MKPHTNSHLIVAREIFANLGMSTKLNIHRGDRIGVEDLDLVTEGYARQVRDELIGIIWKWCPTCGGQSTTCSCPKTLAR